MLWAPLIVVAAMDGRKNTSEVLSFERWESLLGEVIKEILPVPWVFSNGGGHAHAGKHQPQMWTTELFSDDMMTIEGDERYGNGGAFEPHSRQRHVVVFHCLQLGLKGIPLFGHLYY